MRKDNKIMKFASFVLLITVIALILVAGTYAKYTSTATGSDTAVVAKWDIKAGKSGSNLLSIKDGTVAFNLFETINDELTGNKETDVTSGKIAPGTKGEFELAIQNNSEVNAKYEVNFTVTKSESIKNANILFSTDGNNWDANLEKVAGTIDMTDNAETEDVNETAATVKVMWKWAYETGDNAEAIKAGDTADTAVGVSANEQAEDIAKTITVQATLTATQVD